MSDEYDQLNDIGERVKALRERMPADSPIHGIAFQLAAIVGKMQAELAAHNNVLNDRVPYCVVKRNCNGPSLMTEKHESRTGIKQRWVCRRCGGFVLSPDGAIPPQPHKIEP